MAAVAIMYILMRTIVSGQHYRSMVVGPSLTVTTPVPPREQFDQPISPLQASIEETLEAVVESISATVLSAVALIVRASTRPVDTVKDVFDLISSAPLLWLTQASDVLKNMTRDLVTTAVKKIASDRVIIIIMVSIIFVMLLRYLIIRCYYYLLLR